MALQPMSPNSSVSVSQLICCWMLMPCSFVQSRTMLASMLSPRTPFNTIRYSMPASSLVPASTKKQPRWRWKGCLCPRTSQPTAGRKGQLKTLNGNAGTAQAAHGSQTAANRLSPSETNIDTRGDSAVAMDEADALSSSPLGASAPWQPARNVTDALIMLDESDVGGHDGDEQMIRPVPKPNAIQLGPSSATDHGGMKFELTGLHGELDESGNGIITPLGNSVSDVVDSAC
eukprot:TRINITY_DN8921_c0_g2_i2.p1 TRINITY_DN8921_c0_g2~~TRINITY_DN8921_c0_g2_i2.p1  ORF type:complete len:231 (-),score=29.59 TRINITY_DN8921_c0_g2_i2:132-824(-)